MAKRQITIDDGSKGRKQVDFDVQPLNLNPAITNGGRWDVQVAPTPKTTQAQQLSESLKTLPRVAQQFSKLQKGLGTDRAGAISGADAEEELQRLKKEEPDTFTNFIRNKAYKDSLIEKHVRTQMVPKTLTSMKKSANARVYTTEKDFNANLDEQVSTSWAEFEASVGADIANSTEGRTIWNNLTDNIRGEAQVAYYASKDAVALENDLDSVEHRISSLMSPTDLEGNSREVKFDFVPEFTRNTVKSLMDSHDMSRGQAMTHMRGTMARQIEKLNVQGQHLKALDLAEALSRTVGTDGVRLYEDDSETSLKIARATKVARKGIEDLEDDRNDIEQQDLNEYSGSMLRATTDLGHGKRFANITPLKQEGILLSLQLLDPTYTREKLDAAMAAKEEGDLGGGLAELKDILDDLAVNGSDRAALMINLTAATINRSIVTQSQIKGQPIAVRNKDKRLEYEAAYRSERMVDPDLTLVDFLIEKNVTGWKDIQDVDAKMGPVNDVMKTDSYTGADKMVKEAINTVYGQLEEQKLLGAVSSKALPSLISGFTASIQQTLIEEIESGELIPEDVKKRTSELMDNVTSSMGLILGDTGGGDILLQDTDTPKTTGKEELLHDTVSDEKRVKPYKLRHFLPFGSYDIVIGAGEPFEMEAQFKTNAYQQEAVKQNRDGGKYLGIVQLTERVNKNWTQEDIDGDRAEMVKRINSSATKGPYKEALKFNLYTYGLDIMSDPAEAISMMTDAGMDARDVSLFTEKAEVDVYVDRVFDAYKKIVDADKLTPQDIKTVEQARTLGLLVDGELNEQQFAERLHTFRGIQLQQQKRHGR